MKVRIKTSFKKILFLLLFFAAPGFSYTNIIDPSNKGDSITTDIPFVHIDKGLISAIKSQQGLLIKEQYEWLQVWQNHVGKKNNLNNLPPAINFNQFMVIAIFGGQRNCDSVKVEKITDNGTNLIVHVKVSSNSIPRPGNNDISPYDFVKLPKISKTAVFQTE